MVAAFGAGWKLISCSDQFLGWMLELDASLAAAVLYFDNQIFKCVSECQSPVINAKPLYLQPLQESVTSWSALPWLCVQLSMHMPLLRADMVGELSLCWGGGQLYPLPQSCALKADESGKRMIHLL